jgi:hypothetical protein
MYDGDRNDRCPLCLVMEGALSVANEIRRQGRSLAEQLERAVGMGRCPSNFPGCDCGDQSGKLERPKSGEVWQVKGRRSHLIHLMGHGNARCGLVWVVPEAGDYRVDGPPTCKLCLMSWEG